MGKVFEIFDRFLIHELHERSIPIMRIAIGIVFFWFGALKALGVSPVVDLIASTIYFFEPEIFIQILGFWEMLIGLGLLFRIQLRGALALMWMLLAGTFLSFFLAPGTFFNNGNILLLTMEGEFVMKNLVLVTAGLVIAGHELGKK